MSLLACAQPPTEGRGAAPEASLQPPHGPARGGRREGPQVVTPSRWSRGHQEGFSLAKLIQERILLPFCVSLLTLEGDVSHHLSRCESCF